MAWVCEPSKPGGRMGLWEGGRVFRKVLGPTPCHRQTNQDRPGMWMEALGTQSGSGWPWRTELFHHGGDREEGRSPPSKGCS